MNLKIVLIVVLAVCLVQTEAGWFRRAIRRVGRFIRRTVRTVKDKVCPIACPRVCDISGSRRCRIICRLGCNRGKREAVENVVGHVTPLANQFSAYDLNDDGVISRNELALAIGEDESHPDFIKAYSLADVDGNMFLTEKEFYSGPFVFEMDLDDDDLSYCRYRLDLDDDLVDIIEGNSDEQGPNFIDGVEVKDTGKPTKISNKVNKDTWKTNKMIENAIKDTRKSTGYSEKNTKVL